MNELLEAALKYAEAGYAIFPLAPGKKSPLSKNGFKDATTDVAQIRKWWEITPDANIGLPMGKINKLAGIDIDYKDGCDPKFLERCPHTAVQHTANKGNTALFKWPDGGVKNIKKIEIGATIRGEGSYFVVAPSIFIDDKTGEKRYYSWVNGGLVDTCIEDLPQWMITCDEIKSTTEKDFSRHDLLRTVAVRLRHEGVGRDGIHAEIVRLNTEMERQGIGGKPQDEIEQIVNWTIDTVTPDPEHKPSKISEAEVELLAREILDVRFKLKIDGQASVLYNIKNISKKELEICLNEEFLLRRLRQNMLERTGKAPSANFLNHLFTTWKLSTSTISDPAPFCWSDQDDWTFKKLEFKPCEGTFSAWQEFLARLSSPEDFMAFVWSIFEIKSHSRQYLYLYDPEGLGGKSTVINVLGEVFGNSYTAINNTSVNAAGARWLLGNIYGKRLVGWPDCKNTKFCMTELLRNITSGDDVAVEFKGLQPFTTRMYVKFIIGSNHEPSITGGGADTSRLIRINVAKNTKDDPAWQNRLRQELPHFLFECQKHYRAKCPTHGNIKLAEGTHELIQSSTEDVESRYEAIVASRIIIDPLLESTVVEWMDLCHDYHLTDMQIGNFKDYLRQKYGVGLKRRYVVGQYPKKVTYCSGFKIAALGHTVHTPDF